MKALFIALAILAAPLAHADWMRVTPDHFNGLYQAGEQAKFSIAVFGAPTNGDFTQVLTIVDPANPSPVALPITGGHAFYESLPLSAGSSEFQVQLRLIGPGTDVVLENKSVLFLGN